MFGGGVEKRDQPAPVDGKNADIQIVQDIRECGKEPLSLAKIEKKMEYMALEKKCIKLMNINYCQNQDSKGFQMLGT